MRSDNETFYGLAIPMLGFADLISKLLNFLDRIEHDRFCLDEAPFRCEFVDGRVRESAELLGTGIESVKMKTGKMWWITQDVFLERIVAKLLPKD